ncbi:hypothetical protein MES4922_160089 [Mesorhizobium ventifaucium]|uniref:Uncharacterized protein n=1 Tax=Mesorhizobium ventifaucium TaxID=666020 RepID=A0ABM9DI25_9HYPH|nr:hypothetical protein MES4922_160089 [Mesorhizobium ventifaucium]
MKHALFTRNRHSTKLPQRLFRHSFSNHRREVSMTVVTPKFGMGASVLRREEQEAAAK